MIVYNSGYLNLSQVLELIQKKQQFCIYKTNKDTMVLVKEAQSEKEDLYFAKKYRLPYKITEGKKISRGVRVFDSSKDDVETLTTTGWNNDNQIMSYEPH